MPPEYYPTVNGRDYLNSVIVRNKKLEENLERYPEKKKDFHKRIQCLIEDGSLQFVGKWKDVKPRFEGVQAKGSENLVLPWQLVKKSGEGSEMGKLRACLDATMQNMLLFRGENRMTVVVTLSIK